MNELRYLLNELCLIDLIGYLGNDDPCPIGLVLLYLRFCADEYLAPSGEIRMPDADIPHDYAAGWEIGTGDIVHKLINGYIGIIYHRNACIDGLAEVMRRDIRCHTDRNTV